MFNHARVKIILLFTIITILVNLGFFRHFETATLDYAFVFMSNFSHLHSQHFKQYVIKSHGDKFLRCEICAVFKDLLWIHTKNIVSHLAILKASLWHLTLQESYGNNYYKDRILSKCSSKEVVCIIHDKMDYGKKCFMFLRTKTNVLTNRNVPQHLLQRSLHMVHLMWIIRIMFLICIPLMPTLLSPPL